MARDRKRAKQRRARQAVSQRPARPRPEREPEVADAPSPLEHASADAEIAEEAIAGVPVADFEPGGPLEPDELPQPDELEGLEEFDEDEDADEAAPAARRRAPRQREEHHRSGNRVINFLRACWAELKRVQWPDRRQVIQATAVTIGFVAIAGGYLGAMDAIFSRLVNAIL
jgi:preprotein translocase SecE subunit